MFLRDNFKKNYLKMKKMADIERKTLSKCKNIFGQTDWDKRVSRILAPNSFYWRLDRIIRSEFYQHEWEYKSNKNFKIITTISNNFIRI